MRASIGSASEHAEYLNSLEMMRELIVKRSWDWATTPEGDAEDGAEEEPVVEEPVAGEPVAGEPTPKVMMQPRSSRVGATMSL